MELKQIAANFLSGYDIVDVQPFGNGHINSTYKVTTVQAEVFILQKINTKVFTNPQNIVHNHLQLQNVVVSGDMEIPYLLKAENDQYLFIDNENNVWRMMNFIKDSYSVEVVENDTQAFEAGKGYGWFMKACARINSSKLHEAIKDFHSLSLRVKQLNDAIQNNKANRIDEASELITFYKQREYQLLEIEAALTKNKIPKRVVHNDTKINNLLFRNEKAVAVIDLDTVGPGVVLFDYGDAIRTICNAAAEDEQDYTKVEFNVSAFENFTKAYLQQTRSVLVVKEKELLIHAPFYMTFIMGIRFLADYLNGDVYYKTKYAEHNFVRSSVQKTFIEAMESNLDKMKNIIQKYAI